MLETIDIAEVDEIARQYGEEIGLTFIGRGFDMEIQTPLTHSFDEGIRESAPEASPHAAAPPSPTATRKTLRNAIRPPGLNRNSKE